MGFLIFNFSFVLKRKIVLNNTNKTDIVMMNVGFTNSVCIPGTVADAPTSVTVFYLIVRLF